MRAVILGGQEVSVDAEVKTWKETGLQFLPDQQAGVHKRGPHPDTIVWHWTGAENPPERVYQTLRERGLGVEFSVARDGTIYQFCDPAYVDARDCGSMWDRRSVGVEIVSYGMSAPVMRPWSWYVPAPGRDRPKIKTRLRGSTVYVAGFYAAQVASCAALADTLRVVFAIPRKIPLDDSGRILDRPLTWRERVAWKGGEVGHLQITTGSKPDPGVPFLEDRLLALAKGA